MSPFRSMLFAALSLSFILIIPVVAQLDTINITFPAHPPNASLYNVVQDNFLGISWELSSFDTLWGHNTSNIPGAMQNYLSNIRARMSSPLRIRVGGNGMDSSTYVPTQTDKMIHLTDPDAYFNDIPADFGPVLFEVMNTMTDNVGSMEFIIGLSMQDPDNYDNAVELALDAKKMLGDRLDAMLLGNEPDLYQGHGKRESYEIKDYIPEVGGIFERFRDAGVVNGNDSLIGGPTTCCRWDLDEIISAGLNQYPYKYYTLQHYPNHNCGGPTPANTNMSFYISHSNVPKYIWWNDGNYRGIQMAKASGVPLLLTEYNSVSCGGSNISDTFGMALWATDIALQAAATNYSGAYLHTREYGITYNLFDPPPTNNSLASGWYTGPIYYTMLVVAETLSSTGSIVVDLNVTQDNAAAYGIYDNAGKTRGKILFINYASPEFVEEGQPTNRVLRIPANLTAGVGVRILDAPSVYSKSPSNPIAVALTDTVTWANQTVGDFGDLIGTRYTESFDCEKGCSVNVPGPGIALIYFLSDGPDNFYDGNSTIVGPVLVSGSSSSLPSALSLSGTILFGAGLLLFGLL